MNGLLGVTLCLFKGHTIIERDIRRISWQLFMVYPFICKRLAARTFVGFDFWFFMVFLKTGLTVQKPKSDTAFFYSQSVSLLLDLYLQWGRNAMPPASIRNTWKQRSWLLWPTVPSKSGTQPARHACPAGCLLQAEFPSFLKKKIQHYGVFF